MKQIGVTIGSIVIADLSTGVSEELMVFGSIANVRANATLDTLDNFIFTLPAVKGSSIARTHGRWSLGDPAPSGSVNDGKKGRKAAIALTAGDPASLNYIIRLIEFPHAGAG